MKELAYAKINLTLNILNKRNDGYHNLKSVMIPINLYDELYFEHNDTYILNSDIEDNIITKVFNIFKNKYNISNVKITLNKIIPTQAGLAGGSADATATIRGLNKLFDLNLSIEEQEDIANEVGSDTLFTLHNKPAIISSRGDEINFLNTNHDFNILLIFPKIKVSTKEAFANITEYNLEHNNNIISYLEKNDIDNIDNSCYNSFLNSLLTNNEFKEVYDNICLFKKPHLSGSGSTLFIIDKDINKLKEISKNIKYDTKIVSTNNINYTQSKITMYNMNFGDSFIINNNNCNLLVDFGSKNSLTNPNIDTIVKRMSDSTFINKYLITHFHKDHFSYTDNLIDNSLDEIIIRNVFDNNYQTFKVSFLSLILNSKNSLTHANALATLFVVPTLYKKLKINKYISFVKKGNDFSVGSESFKVMTPLDSLKYIKNLDKVIDNLLGEIFIKNSDWKPLIEKLINLHSDLIIKDDKIFKNDKNNQIINQINDLKKVIDSFISSNEKISINKKSLYYYDYEHKFNIMFINKRNTILMSGDMDIKIFKKIIKELEIQNIRNMKIIKVPHHGTNKYSFTTNINFDNILVPYAFYNFRGICNVITTLDFNQGIISCSDLKNNNCEYHKKYNTQRPNTDYNLNQKLEKTFFF